MKPKTIVAASIALFSCSTFAFMAFAADKATPPAAASEKGAAEEAAPAAEEGFTPLFNGKDLTGWQHGGKKDAPSMAGKGYQVDDGVLYCTATDGGNLMTEKEYDNFVLRFDFKLEANSNNGIGIHSPVEGNVAYQGIEIQILDDSGSDYQTLQPYQYHGSVYGCVPAKRGSLKPVGEWNSQEIVVDGRRIKVTVNDKVIVDTNLDEDVKDPEVLKAHPGLANKTGRIALLGHGTRVDFKNLRVKEIK